MGSIWEKRPGETMQFTFDWAPNTNGRAGASSDRLASGETITGSAVSADSGITVESYGQTDSNTSVTCMLSGGTAGTSYTVTCTISTSSSQILVRENEVKVIPRYT